jgi:hypothetical protein
VAIQNPKDRDVKRVGQKIAFGSAVAKSDFTKSDKTDLWEAFAYEKGLVLA